VALSLVDELKHGMLQNLTEAMADPDAWDEKEAERQEGFHPVDLDEVKKNSFPDHKGRPGLRGGSLPRGESDQEVDELKEKAVKSGGFTYNPVRWKDREPPKNGFALSVRKDTEKVVDLSAKRDELRKQLKQYIHEHRADIKAQGNFLGGWIDNGKLYLDISKVVGERQKAIELAQKADQLAIFDLGKGETIDVKKAA
jgi:hypothetical protein